MDIINGEYPPGVFFSEKPKILRPLIFLRVNFETPYFFPNKFDTPYFIWKFQNPLFRWYIISDPLFLGPPDPTSPCVIKGKGLDSFGLELVCFFAWSKTKKCVIIGAFDDKDGDQNCTIDGLQNIKKSGEL